MSLRHNPHPFRLCQMDTPTPPDPSSQVTKRRDKLITLLLTLLLWSLFIVFIVASAKAGQSFPSPKPEDLLAIREAQVTKADLEAQMARLREAYAQLQGQVAAQDKRIDELKAKAFANAGVDDKAYVLDLDAHKFVPKDSKGGGK